ncbi:MAG: N-acetyl-gamma-glutamyl-phosphate reductase [Deltaproteobacteria bacterium]|nr:N-acetyl-gamma-glutamyl-phosphate reductase [Deltaproteobacteria bacterium]
MNDIPVVVVGASGYTGAELLRLLVAHPRVHVVSVHAKTRAGEPLSTVFPQFGGQLDLTLEPLDPSSIARRARVAFLAMPHGEAGPTAAILHELGMTVIDLSADFRLRSPEEHAAWYGGGNHDPQQHLRSVAVYGLPERYRDKLKDARLIAAPGCYPTASILAIAPLLEAGLVSAQDIVIDAKSGVSGAGRSPALPYHFPEAGEGVRAYKIAGSHRHVPEIEQELTVAAGHPVRVMFTPHLVPMSRGILACVYAKPTDPSRPARVYRDALVARYSAEPLVTVLPEGQLPDTAFVRGSNRVHVTAAYDSRAERVIALSAIDNLVKGAAGQAVQAMNCALGLPETMGLVGGALFP